MSVVHVDAPVNREVCVTAPPGHPVGDVEIMYMADGSISVEVRAEESDLVVRRADFSPALSFHIGLRTEDYR